MDPESLPTILERKQTLDGATKEFRCRLLQRSTDGVVVLFIADRSYQVGGLTLPAGTITFGHFWPRRPYNVYHWLTPGGATLAYYFNLSTDTEVDGETIRWHDLTVDVLAVPGAAPVILDEDELPAGLDAGTRTLVEQARAAVLAALSSLPAALEAEADSLWQGLFGVEAPVITLVQRVTRAAVRVGDETVGEIAGGLLLLVGVERGDGEADADATARKIAALRIFPGKHPMDQAVKDVGGACLVVSQFTLAGSIRKGNRPGFEGAEEPARANALYTRVADKLAAEGIPVATGRFAADMQVDLVNDGPVTFVVVVREGAVQKTER